MAKQEPAYLSVGDLARRWNVCNRTAFSRVVNEPGILSFPKIERSGSTEPE